jgi:hypothetical protein
MPLNENIYFQIFSGNCPFLVGCLARGGTLLWKWAISGKNACFLSESTLSKGYRILIKLGELVPIGAYGPNSIKDWKVLEIAFSYMGYQSLDF